MHRQLETAIRVLCFKSCQLSPFPPPSSLPPFPQIFPPPFATPSVRGPLLNCNARIRPSPLQIADTYLHRVGRAGRFGTKGLAITFVSSKEDSDVLNAVQVCVKGCRLWRGPGCGVAVYGCTLAHALGVLLLVGLRVCGCTLAHACVCAMEGPDMSCFVVCEVHSPLITGLCTRLSLLVKPCMPCFALGPVTPLLLGQIADIPIPLHLMHPGVHSSSFCLQQSPVAWRHLC